MSNVVTGKYSIISADPPWRYGDRCPHSDTVFGGGAKGQYDLMDNQDLIDMGPLVRERTADTALLFLWGTSPHLPSIIPVMEAWGFEFVTKAFNWVKVCKNGNYATRPGHYTASNSEDCWLGIKGKYSDIVPARKMTNQIVETIHDEWDITIRSRSREHSRKPGEVAARIELMYPEHRKLELFCRYPRKGWDYLGNEIDGFDIRDALAEPLGLDEVDDPDKLLSMMSLWSDLTASGIHPAQLFASLGG